MKAANGIVVPTGPCPGDLADRVGSVVRSDMGLFRVGNSSPAADVDRGGVGWTAGRLAGMVLLAAAAVVAMFDAWGDIFTFATRNEENTHILLTPIVAGWLFYIRRDALLSHRPRFSYAGPAVIALAWGMSAWGYYHAVQVLWHLGAVVAVLGAVLTFTGVGRDRQGVAGVCRAGVARPDPRGASQRDRPAAAAGDGPRDGGDLRPRPAWRCCGWATCCGTRGRTSRWPRRANGMRMVWGAAAGSRSWWLSGVRSSRTCGC